MIDVLERLRALKNELGGINETIDAAISEIEKSRLNGGVRMIPIVGTVGGPPQSVADLLREAEELRKEGYTEAADFAERSARWVQSFGKSGPDGVDPTASPLRTGSCPTSRS